MTLDAETADALGYGQPWTVLTWTAAVRAIRGPDPDAARRGRKWRREHPTTPQPRPTPDPPEVKRAKAAARLRAWRAQQDPAALRAQAANHARAYRKRQAP